MASSSFELETLEALLDKCTDPATGKEDWRYINALCDRVNKDYDGPILSTKLIIRKLQTFEEKSSLMALSVLEACVKNCGQKYHQEIGKFRFLNELIKLLSSKYDGPRTTQPVKHKIIELFYSWSVGLPSETKIKEAYLMLKRQGVVSADPCLPSQVEPYKPTPQPRMAVFEDDEKSKLLARLLASKHPDDLQAANRLIKNMVRQDEIREEKLSLRVQELEMVENNTKLLNDMLSHYSSSTPQSDVDLMKELYDSCEKLRTDLFKLAATATEEGDDSLSEILRANDNLMKVIECYRRTVGDPSESRPTVPTSSTGQDSEKIVSSNENFSNLSSLIDLDMSNSGGDGSRATPMIDGNILSNDLQDLVLGLPASQNPPAQQPNPTIPFAPVNQNILGPRPPLAPWPNAAVSSGIPTASASVSTIRGMQPYSSGMPPMMVPPPRPQVMFPRPPQPISSRPPQPISPSSGNMSWSANVVNRMKADETKPRGPSPLDLLGQEALTAHKESQNKPKTANNIHLEKQDSTLIDIGSPVLPSQPTPSIPPPPAAAPSIPPPPAAAPSILPPPAAAPTSNGPKAHDTSLDQISLSMDKIQPGNLTPMNVLEKNGVKTVMHFAKDSSRSLRNDIHVIVVTTMSTNASPVKTFTFQCAAPKSMKLKLQPPSSNELPGYNPILPPSAITQVMLLSNPTKDRIRLKFRISYEVNGIKSVETGDLDGFPIL